MLQTLQNFYKATVSTTWAAGTGNRYVSVLPTPTSGRLVINPSDISKREIVSYSAIGTDSGGNYITLSARGVGGTTDQVHAVNEAVRMNLTAQHYSDIQTELTTISTSVTTLDGEVVKKTGDQTITSGVKTFVVSPIVPEPTTATQAASKNYVDTTAVAGAPNASTTVKGIVEIATQGEYDAGTDIGGTGAALVVPPSIIKAAINNAGATVTTMMPKISMSGAVNVSGIGRLSNTRMDVGMIDVTESMTVNKVSVCSGTVSVSGTYKIGLYSLDGQTKLIDATTPTVSSSNTIATITLGSPLSLAPGKYYTAIVPIGTASSEFYHQYTNSTLPFISMSGENTYTGYLTVTAGTLPTTFNPISGVTEERYSALVIRFDN